MRAARIHRWGALPQLDEMPEPSRAPDEVLVAVEAAAVTHLDATVAGGDFDLRPALPYVGGVEGAGRVLEAPGDAPVAVGSQVVLRGGGLGLRRDGTWAERITVPVSAVRPLDPELPVATAATFFVPATTAFVALHDVGAVHAGERVAVVGAAGAVGAMVVQQARAAGAEVVGVVAGAEQAARLPAGVEAVDTTEAGAASEFGAARAVTLLVDTLGGADLARRLRWVAPGGRAVVVGYTLGTSVTLDLPSWLLDDVAVLPVNMVRRERRAREIAPGLIAELAAGRLTVETQSYALDEAAAAYRDLRSGRVRGRAVLVP